MNLRDIQAKCVAFIYSVTNSPEIDLFEIDLVYPASILYSHDSIRMPGILRKKLPPSAAVLCIAHLLFAVSRYCIRSRVRILFKACEKVTSDEACL